MANGQGSIDEVIGQKAIDDVAKFEASLKALTEQMKDALTVANQLNSATGLKSVSAGVAGVDNAIKKTKEYTLTIAAQAVEQRRVRAEMNQTAKEISDTAGAYTNLDAAQQKAAKAARDAGIQFGIQSEQFKKLSATSNEYLGRLKAVDEALGNSRRNVGNYQGAVFSLSQVIRELPAFTYSAQQGFLAIGNNMPILIDQFKLLRQQVGSTGAAIGIFARSIFSFVNVFTILTGLFTIFYKDIIDFVKGTDKAAENTNRWADSVTEARKEMYSLSEALDMARKGIISKEDYTKRYNETLGKSVGLANDFNTAEKSTLENASLYLRYIEMRTDVESALNKVIAQRKTIESIDPTSWGTMIKAQLSYMGNQFKQGTTPGSALQGLFSSMFSTDDAFNFYKGAADKEMEAVKKVYIQKSEEFELFKKQHGFGIFGSTGGKGGGGKSAEIDRIKEIADEYDQALKKIEIRQMLGGYTDEEYWTAKGELASEYIKKLETVNRLTNTETESKLDTQYKLVKDIKTAATELVELRGGDTEPIDWAKNGNEQLAKLLDYINKIKGEITTVNLGNTEDYSKNYWSSYMSVGQDSMSIISSIETALFQQELQQFDTKEKRLKEYYDNEKRFIEQSGFSASQKQKMQNKLDAETEAKRKQIDRDRITALRKQATFEKAFNVSQAISETAIAVVRALNDKTVPYPVRVAYALSAGVAGAAQVARILATPLPQYAKGRKGGKKEWAVVGEAGQEAIVHNGRVELTPNKPTVTLLPEGASVIPNHELIKNAAYVHLAKQGTVTTDKLQAALIESYERNTKELQQIKAVLIDKNFSLTNNELSGYESYRQSKVQ